MFDGPGVPVLPKRVGIGIDFGMTYSGAAIAFEMPGGTTGIYLIPIQEVAGEPKFPTEVYASPDMRTIDVGKDAWARRDSAHSYTLFKRRLGTSWSPRSGVDAVFLTRKTLEFIKAQIDPFLRARGLDRPQVKKRYVFTFPGAWAPARILALKEAIKQAGFGDDPTLLDEATATAIAAAQMGVNPRMLGTQQTTFICDFGGGTTDFSLIQATEKGFIRLKFVAGGNPLLGMSNLDKVIAMLVARKLGQLQPSGLEALRDHVVAGKRLEDAWEEYQAEAEWKLELLRRSEALKRSAFANWPLFVADVVRVNDGTYKEVTREELEPFVKAMREEVSSAAEDYLTEAQQRGQIARDSIRFILIGGGGSALPEIGSTLRKTMPGAELLPLSASVATSLVQRGAAFYGCDSTLYDRRSIRSYGVVTFRSEKPPYPVTERDIDHGDPDAQGTRETFYPWYEVYVERNQIVRAGDQFTRDFNPLRANQSEVKFEVLEGEDQNPRAKANTHVGEVVLPLPRHAKQTYRTNCAFTIGKDNLLLVRAEGENGKVVEQAMVWQADTLDE